MQHADYAHLYHLEDHFWWFAGMRAITGALLDPVCPRTTGRLILDAGCGTGGMLSWLARYAGNGKVIGIDLVSAALDFCQERGRAPLAQASVMHLPFADSTFDLFTSFDVLYQLPGNRSDELAIREMYRVLRPAGVAFVRVAAYEWMKSSHDEALGTQRRYLLDELSEKMEDAGLEILRATYANTILLPVAIVNRLVLQRLGLVESGSDVKPLPKSLRWLNGALIGLLRSEACFLKAPKAQLPAGLSAICVARKPKMDRTLSYPPKSQTALTTLLTSSG
jgi:ubiquinone/menaquinone biosynthesis C-methylase UbiE